MTDKKVRDALKFFNYVKIGIFSVLAIGGTLVGDER